MIKGNMQLDIMEGGIKREILIKEGQIFLLPSRIPHSPQRFPDTIGLVIERERAEDELDGLRWYVPNKSDVLFEEWFHCVDLGTQLKPIIEIFFSSEEFKSKKPTRNFPPPPFELDLITKPAKPEFLVDILPPPGDSKTLFDSEFKIDIITGSHTLEFKENLNIGNEIFLWQLKGERSLIIESSKAMVMKEGNVMMVPSGVKCILPAVDDICAKTMVVINKKVAKKRLVRITV